MNLKKIVLLKKILEMISLTKFKKPYSAKKIFLTSQKSMNYERVDFTTKICLNRKIF